MGNGASTPTRCKAPQPGDHYPVQQAYPVQPPPQPPQNPPAYNEPLHVPVSFYPDNVYTTSRGNGTIAQISREIDNFDYQLTETLDGNRYYNRVHDPSIPPAPGMVQMVCMTARHPPAPQPSTSSYPPPPSYPHSGPLPTSTNNAGALPEKRSL